MRNMFEPIVEQASSAILRALEAIPEARVPYGAVHLTKAEQRERYFGEHRDDPEFWRGVIRERGVGEAIRYWEAMEGGNAG